MSDTHSGIARTVAALREIAARSAEGEMHRAEKDKYWKVAYRHPHGSAEREKNAFLAGQHEDTWRALRQTTKTQMRRLTEGDA